MIGDEARQVDRMQAVDADEKDMGEARRRRFRDGEGET
jgi:hypothetical protein